MLLFPLIACVIDSSLNGKPADADTSAVADSGLDGADTDTDTDTGSSTPSLPVDCPDLATSPAESVAMLAECSGEDTWPDPWNIVEEWHYGSSVGFGGPATAATGYLTDGDGDGTLGSAGDIPVVVYSDSELDGTDETLRVLAGDGSGTVWTHPRMLEYCGVAIADVNADGWTEVLAFAYDGTVVAFDAAGAELWRSDGLSFSWWEELAVADLDGDGLPEVIADNAVLNGEDGSTAFLLPDSLRWSAPTPGDLNLDGTQEIVLGPAVYDAAGNVLWTAATAATDAFAALVQADADPEGEVAFVTGDGYYLHDTDGTLLAAADLPHTGTFAQPGPPCVADLDGDGDPELAVMTVSEAAVLELDGTLRWSSPVMGAGPAGCSAFDFDGDGASELLVEDNWAVYIFDGSTGREQWSWRPGMQIANTDAPKYPYVVDVDGDGETEIVATTYNDPSLGVFVFGHATGDWPPAGPTWGVQDFSESNLEDDGGIPAAPTPPWSRGVFRARPARAGVAPDLYVTIEDVCVADCTLGAVELAVSVTNQGSEDVPAGAALGIHAVEDTGDRLVATVVLPDVPAGTRIATTTVSLAITDVGSLGFAASVDLDGQVEECDETNNRAVWSDTFCP